MNVGVLCLNAEVVDQGCSLVGWDLYEQNLMNRTEDLTH